MGFEASRNIMRSNPFCFGGKCVGYEPGESDEKIKGGNSNWRGPIWFPTSYLLIRTLMKFGGEFGEQLMTGVPDRDGAPGRADHPGLRDCESHDQHIQERSGRTTALLRRVREISDRSSLERLSAVQRVLPWRDWSGVGRESSDRLVGAGREPD